MIAILMIGVAQVEREFEVRAAQMPSNAERFVRRAGEIIIGESRKQFVGSRTRSRYEIRGGKRVARHPARPVTSPADKLGVFEGTYRKQITQDVRRVASGTYETEIGPDGIPYARVHELGIGRMPKRPVMAPGLEAALPKIERDADRLGEWR